MTLPADSLPDHEGKGSRITEAARELLDIRHKVTPDYEHALVDLVIQYLGLSQAGDFHTVRDWLELQSLRECPRCGDTYDLDDGIDWEMCAGCLHERDTTGV